jgi:hypothetical protein
MVASPNKLNPADKFPNNKENDDMSTSIMGVIGTSKKVDERRFPVHPEHLSRIPEALRRQLIFEEGYGA